MSRVFQKKYIKNPLSAGLHKNPFNYSIDIVFFRTFDIQFKSKITKCYPLHN